LALTLASSYLPDPDAPVPDAPVPDEPEAPLLSPADEPGPPFNAAQLCALYWGSVLATPAHSLAVHFFDDFDEAPFVPCPLVELVLSLAVRSDDAEPLPALPLIELPVLPRELPEPELVAPAKPEPLEPVLPLLLAWLPLLLASTELVVLAFGDFLFLFMSPKARAEPLVNATIVVKTKAGAILRIVASWKGR
jgi:hypothetical protein